MSKGAAREAAAAPRSGELRPAGELRRILDGARVERLANGLLVATLAAGQAPLVTTALIYRAGTRDDEAGHGGTAHFLEHMMFKGSPRYGPGEIDLLTRALGGSNNAFTSHDMTLYYFTFAADRWQQALEIESDRMAGLTLDAEAVRHERQVILEEIAMYEGEPWDALEQRVSAAAFPGHPYGRPVLGTREQLLATGAEALAAFHQRLYRPANAVLVVAGDVGGGVTEQVEAAFGGLDGEAPRRAPSPPPAAPNGLVRLERRAGEVARMLLSLPAPAATADDHPLLRLLVAVLGAGRSSRLHRALVDEGQLCVGVSADLNESVDPGGWTVAFEVIPGIEPRRAEETALAEIERLRRQPPSAEEVARAQKIVLADWIFDHERVYQQAFLVGTALALFDVEHPWRYLDRLLSVRADDLAAAAERYLSPERAGVLGWSLPVGSSSEPSPPAPLPEGEGSSRSGIEPPSPPGKGGLGGEGSR
ncbi:MAG TPA: pitrilysin family protein [Thermoanaerobaculia bacterium]